MANKFDAPAAPLAEQMKSWQEQQAEATAYAESVRQKIERASAADWEQRARDTAVRFGVDPNLSPKDRCMAIMKATGLVRVAQTLVANARKQPDRVPGEDDE